MLNSRTLGVLAICLPAAALAIPAATGCRPRTSQESIYRDIQREPDPADDSPYLDPGAPGAAHVNVARAIAEQPDPPHLPGSPQPSDYVTYESADPPDLDPLVRVWVDGQAPAAAMDRKTMALSEPVSVSPQVRFAMDPRMGQLRSAVIEVYHVADGRVQRTSGVRLTELTDGDVPIERRVLAPDRDIELLRPGGEVTVSPVAGGAGKLPAALDADQQYEIQFVVGGSLLNRVLAVRVHTVGPPTTQPAEPASPGPPQQPPALPPGVTAPPNVP